MTEAGLGASARSAAPGRNRGDRLPQPPRQRKPALAALAVLLIVGGAFSSAVLVLRSGDRVPVIAIRREVPAGRRLAADDMVEVQVAKTDVATVPWATRSEVLKYYAAVKLVPGTLLNSRMVAATGNFTPNTVVIGVSLKAGQVPPVGLTQGSLVRVYSVDESTPVSERVLAMSAVVHGFDAGKSDIGSGNSDLRVSLIVDAASGPAIAAAASAGKVALALLPETGTSG